MSSDDHATVPTGGFEAAFRRIKDIDARVRALEASIGGQSSTQEVDSVYDEIGEHLDSVADECKEILASPECDHHVVKALYTVYTECVSSVVSTTIKAEILPVVLVHTAGYKLWDFPFQYQYYSARRAAERLAGRLGDALYDEDERIDAITTFCERVNDYARGGDRFHLTPAELYGGGLDVAVDRIIAGRGVSRPLISHTGELASAFVDACKETMKYWMVEDAIRLIVVLTEVMRTHPAVSVSPDQGVTLGELIGVLLDIVDSGLEAVDAWLLLKYTAGVEPMFTMILASVEYEVYGSIIDYARDDWSRHQRYEMENNSAYYYTPYTSCVGECVDAATSYYDIEVVDARATCRMRATADDLGCVLLYAQLLRENPLPRRFIELVRGNGDPDATYRRAIIE